MRQNQNNHEVDPFKGGTGNASNPSVQKVQEGQLGSSLLDEKAETYLRESGNIEDMPDEHDQRDLEEKANGG